MTDWRSMFNGDAEVSAMAEKVLSGDIDIPDSYTVELTLDELLAISMALVSSEVRKAPQVSHLARKLQEAMMDEVRKTNPGTLD